MPDSCMPMLMITTLSTCQRTLSSSNSLHTDSVSCDDRERCSSCISSISAWMLHLALYHFRAGRQQRKECNYTSVHGLFYRLNQKTVVQCVVAWIRHLCPAHSFNRNLYFATWAFSPSNLFVCVPASPWQDKLSFNTSSPFYTDDTQLFLL